MDSRTKPQPITGRGLTDDISHQKERSHMAKVNAKVLGGNTVEREALTIGDLKQQMNLTNYTAKVNGEIAQDDYYLSEEDFVLFTANAKGAAPSIFRRMIRMIIGR